MVEPELGAGDQHPHRVGGGAAVRQELAELRLLLLGRPAVQRDRPVMLIGGDLCNLGDLALLLQNLGQAPAEGRRTFVRRWAPLPEQVEQQVRDAGGIFIPGKHLARFLSYGASPRATINLIEGGRALAFLRGRPYVLPEDVTDIAPDVLRHRLVLSYEALAEGQTPDALVRRVMQHLPAPPRPLETHVNLHGNGSAASPA